MNINCIILEKKISKKQKLKIFLGEKGVLIAEVS